MEKDFFSTKENPTSNIQIYNGLSLSKSQAGTHSRSVENSHSLEWTQNQQEHAEVQRAQQNSE